MRIGARSCLGGPKIFGDYVIFLLTCERSNPDSQQKTALTYAVRINFKIIPELYLEVLIRNLNSSDKFRSSSGKHYRTTVRVVMLSKPFLMFEQLPIVTVMHSTGTVTIDGTSECLHHLSVRTALQIKNCYGHNNSFSLKICTT